MLTQVKSMALFGVDGQLINVQVDVSSGLPTWDIVGLPDASIKESKQRIRAALKNIDINLPSRKIIINLAPATFKKEGSIFDLPIAVGILCNFNIISRVTIEPYVFLGELSLDGSVNKINGILPMCIAIHKLGIKNVVIPYENRLEASLVPDLKIYPVKTLLDVIKHFRSEKIIKNFKSNISNIFSNQNISCLDFSEVKGQENVKRALEIAAAGGHNCLLIGSPGSGKTMIAKRLPSILPNLTFEESLEITKIHSIAGTLTSTSPIFTSRPFRNPHHTITKSALVGGGIIPKPGEISLAHLGVLFLDELPEFKHDVLELLRTPLEERSITINRYYGSLFYPANFMLIASMNPCPCGYYGSHERECTCSTKEISKYMHKISGPLLDRIDIHIEVQPVEYHDLSSTRIPESSKDIKKRVNAARNLQLERYKNDKIFSNSELTPPLMKKYCSLSPECDELLKNAFSKLNLSARAHDRILKLARTIADLDNSQNIKITHLAEAIQYRSLDRKYWS